MKNYVIAFFLVMASTCLLTGQKSRSEMSASIGEPQIGEDRHLPAKHEDVLVGEAAVVDEKTNYEGATAVRNTAKANPKVRYPEMGRF